MISLGLKVFGRKGSGDEREGRKGEKEWKEPMVAALFVCVSTVQWSHREASSVCEALLS